MIYDVAEMMRILSFRIHEFHLCIKELMDVCRRTGVRMPNVPNRLRTFSVRVRSTVYDQDATNYLHCKWVGNHLELWTGIHPEAANKPIGWTTENMPLHADKDERERDIRRLAEMFAVRPKAAIAFLRYLEDNEKWIVARIEGLNRHIEHVRNEFRQGKIYQKLSEESIRSVLGRSEVP